MKKVASIVAAALITCSLTACGNRNAAFRTPGTNQGGTNLSMDQGNNNSRIGNVAYRDGIYLGEGNRTSRGNHAAIVTVSGGRITNVVLKTLDPQGKEIYSGNATGNTNNTRAALPGGGTYTGTDTEGGTIDKSPTGTTGSGVTGNTVTSNQGNTGGGSYTGTGAEGGTIDKSPTGTTGGSMNGNTITGTPGHTAGGTATSNFERVRRDLASAIISQQTHNVTVNNVGNDAASVSNWKLAVSRALDSARR